MTGNNKVLNFFVLSLIVKINKVLYGFWIIAVNDKNENLNLETKSLHILGEGKENKNPVKIVSKEGVGLSIESPMEKLESFFVKIVTKAREEKQQTSGAEAGTGISGFLAEKAVVYQKCLTWFY